MGAKRLIIRIFLAGIVVYFAFSALEKGSSSQGEEQKLEIRHSEKGDAGISSGGEAESLSK